MSQTFPLVALVGAPNSGKTTLYNWLTNSNFKTVNYPGATVEYSIGQLSARFGGHKWLMDTPGTYSLFPRSADEEVTLRALYEDTAYGRTQKVLVVCDGTQMERHLILAKQVQEAGFAMVLVITMSDLFRKNQIQVRTEILQDEFQCPVVLFDGLLGGGIPDIVKALESVKAREPRRLNSQDEKRLQEKAPALSALCTRVIPERQKTQALYNTTARWDRLLLHPVLGVVIFFLVMSALFSSIYWLAAPLMDYVDQGFSFIAEQVQVWGGGSLWTEFLSGGVIASFSAVLVFVPQIFILFFLVSLLESSGYLARAGTLIYRPFSMLGLSGRSFVPLLSGFACAIPAMMATRNISSKRDRLITLLVIPLTTCSARLPVYALLLGFLFQGEAAWKPGVALAALYFMSLVLSALAAAVLNYVISKQAKNAKDHSHFMMELPIYRWPKLRVQIVQAWQRTRSYAVRAGPIIFGLAVLLWLGTHFPHVDGATPEQQVEQSYAGVMGRAIEPALHPMGADWKVGIGLLTAFAAREVFVSTLAIVYQVAGDEDTQQEGLLKAMGEAKRSDGVPVFTVASVSALIVFFMIALQCITTVAVAQREFGSTKLALTQLAALNVVAFVLAVVVYQVVSLI